MTFGAPLFLVALAAVPLLALLYARTERGRSRGREAFASAAVMPSVAPVRPGWRRHVPVAAALAALAALVVALARPEVTVAVDVDEAVIMIATDRSGSMLAEDVAPDRLTAAREAAGDFLDNVPEDIRVGAVAFNHTANVVQSPTRNHVAVRNALNEVEAAGSTATGEAISSALAAIDAVRRTGVDPERPAPAAIVLLSDGKSVRGRDPLMLADEAADAGVPIYTVALGTDFGTIETRSGTEEVPPDPATLEQIAERSGGSAYAVEDADKLSEVYRRLGSQVISEEREQEITAAFAGGALLLLVLGVGASLRWFGRVF